MSRKPGIRIDGAKRTNLAKQRQRREDQAKQPRLPVEDTRVSEAWSREDRRAVAARLSQEEREALRKERARPRQQVRSAKVPNPFFQPEHHASASNPMKIEAAINIKESAIETLFAKSAIDDAQKKAADTYRSIWEAMGGKGAGAIDYSRTRVDGGKNAEPISSRQLDAGRKIERIQRELRDRYGEYAVKLVTYVCGQGLSIHEMTETRRQRDTMTDNLRMYLDLMAEEWGYRKRAQPFHPDVRKTVDTRA